MLSGLPSNYDYSLLNEGKHARGNQVWKAPSVLWILKSSSAEVWICVYYYKSKCCYANDYGMKIINFTYEINY